MKSSTIEVLSKESFNFVINRTNLESACIITNGTGPVEISSGEYQLKEEYGATKRYKVPFYFYGGVLSGWNVVPENG